MKTVGLPLTGGCECGTLAYEISGAPFNLWACHCRNCQRQTGSAFVLSMKVAIEHFRFTRGNPSKHIWQSDSGTVRMGLFCGSCGNRIANVDANYADDEHGFASVRAGTLDDTDWLAPTGHIWLDSAQPWVQLSPDDIRSNRQPESDEAYRERFATMFGFV